MSIVPTDLVLKIAFYENHTTPWAASAVAIGTTTTAVTDLTTKTTSARAAYNAQQAAQSAAKAATLAFRSAVKTMGQAGSDIISQIKTKAAITGGESIYILAQIPAPSTPTPVGPPGTPSNFKAQLLENGSLVLNWKCTNPANASGTVYQIYRSTGGTAPEDFSFVGVTGLKKFIDDSLPAGGGPNGNMVYQVIATRSTTSGNPAIFNVRFGTTGTGEMTASVAEAPRMAA